MYARKKRSRFTDYLHIVESKRVPGKPYPQQKVVLYVGPYDSIEEALERLKRERTQWRSKATRFRNHAKEIENPQYAQAMHQYAVEAGKKAEDANRKLCRLQELMTTHPELRSA
jgi:hypothetical protein